LAPPCFASENTIALLIAPGTHETTMEAPLAYSRLEKLLLGPLIKMSANVLNHVLATIILPPLALAITYLTLLFIAVAVAVNVSQWWAWSWATLTAINVLWRASYPLLSRGTHPQRQRLRIILGTAPLFLLFGFGCAACIASGNITLSMIGLISILGIIAGISSRWAAVPRAAVVMISLTTFPPAIVLISHGGLEAVTGVILLLMTLASVTYTLQNHAYLLSAAHAEENLQRLAHTDGLTGLVNRIGLEQLLGLACVGLQTHGVHKQLAVIYMDLDGFKAINDEHGHATGDALLKRVAQLLQVHLPTSSTIARIGGDEFIVLLPGADEISARHATDHVISKLSQEHTLPGGQVVRIGCSAGVSLAPLQGTEPEVLLARADQALYASKHRGKGQTGIWRTL
jgi:diguanylate cyclase (GGDEF)-like protein